MILVGQVNRSCVIRPQGAGPDPPCRGSARRRCAGRAASRSSLLAHSRGSIPSVRSLGSAAIRTDGRLPGREVGRVLPSSLAHGGGPGRSCPTNLTRARCSCPTARPRVRFAVAARRTPASSRPRRDGGRLGTGPALPCRPRPSRQTTPVLAEIAVNVVARYPTQRDGGEVRRPVRPRLPSARARLPGEAGLEARPRRARGARHSPDLIVELAEVGGQGRVLKRPAGGQASRWRSAPAHGYSD